MAPQREWIISSWTCGFGSSFESIDVVPCTDSAVQGNDFELIPMVTMERGHSIEGSLSHKFSWIYIIRELSLCEVGSRKSLAMSSKNLPFSKKTTPCRKIFKILLERDSPPLRSTSCVQISWNLADRKSVVSWCIIYRTKKQQNFSSLSLLHQSRQKSARASGKQCTQSAQISSKSIYFRRSYSWTREHRSNMA